MRPSQYLFDVSLDTEKKLASQRTVKIPKQLELLVMSDSSYQVEQDAEKLCHSVII